MKRRFDSVSCFETFKIMAKDQFDNKIRHFQCDGAKEFVKGDFKCIFDHFGISLRVSYPYIHEQNSIVERKHMHVE